MAGELSDGCVCVHDALLPDCLWLQIDDMDHFGPAWRSFPATDRYDPSWLWLCCVSMALCETAASEAAQSEGVAVRNKEARKVDGKAFFRSARDKLSYEDFSTLLASMKRFNNLEQTRDQTLNAAKKLLGPENKYLQEDFELLLDQDLASEVPATYTQLDGAAVRTYSSGPKEGSIHMSGDREKDVTAWVEVASSSRFPSRTSKFSAFQDFLRLCEISARLFLTENLYLSHLR